MLKHRLALRLSRTIAELEATMSPGELEEWRVFDIAEPIGDERLDFLAGLIRSAVRPELPAENVFPHWARWVDEIAITPEEMAQRVSEQTKAAIRAFAARRKIPIIQN